MNHTNSETKSRQRKRLSELYENNQVKASEYYAYLNEIRDILEEEDEQESVVDPKHRDRIEELFAPYESASRKRVLKRKRTLAEKDAALKACLQSHEHE